MMNINIYNRRAFWDNQHTAQNMKALSNCSFEEIEQGLHLIPIMRPKMKILEIGVGTGRATQQMREAGHLVSALDISLIALDKVSHLCEKVYTLNKLPSLPSDYFDLIICGNVVQHTPTEMLEIEIRECMRALNSKGVFAVQFVSCGDVDDKGEKVESNLSELGCYGRTPHFMERLFSTYGGMVSIVSSTKVNIYQVTASYVFHVFKLNRNV